MILTRIAKFFREQERHAVSPGDKKMAAFYAEAAEDAEKELRNLRAGKVAYVVVTTYSFDPDTQAVGFPDEGQAKAYLKKTFENETRIDREENQWETHASIDNDGTYAKITNRFPDHEDTTEFFVVQVQKLKTCKEGK